MVKDLKQKLSDKIEALLSRRKVDWKEVESKPERTAKGQREPRIEKRARQKQPDTTQGFSSGF